MTNKENKIKKFQLPQLPYEYDDLEPFICKTTMITHHTKHHQAYIDKANKILSDNKIKEIELMNLVDSDILKENEMLRHNVGGHFNHSFFWKCMCKPSVRTTIYTEKSLPIDSLKEKFIECALSIKASGWVWLLYNVENDNLEVVKTSDQEMPFNKKNKYLPILNLDVWEHAYYLKYLNDRTSYIKAWWNLINWEFVTSLYENAVNYKKSILISNDGNVII